MPELIAPTVRLHTAWRDARDDWGPGSHEDGFGLRPTDQVDTPAGFATWVARLTDAADPTKPLDGHQVPCTYRWIVEDDRVLGGIVLRHRLTDLLRHARGHIGYGVRPSARRRGVGGWPRTPLLDRAVTRGPSVPPGILPGMRTPLPEPGPSSDVPALFLSYLDYYRDTVADRLTGLTDAQARTALVPSGWSPVELVKHLTHMERRWLVWGFLGEQVPDPWGDRVDDRWHVAPDETVADLVAALHRGGTRTREIVEATPPATPAALGGRFTDPARRPTLTTILFHVLQEYARHAGHLDVVRELADGRTGE